jgi:hypothetical protein
MEVVSSSTGLSLGFDEDFDEKNPRCPGNATEKPSPCRCLPAQGVSESFDYSCDHAVSQDLIAALNQSCKQTLIKQATTKKARTE